MYPYIYCSIIHNSQDIKQPKYPSMEWIKKLWYSHTMEYYSYKTEGNIATSDSMDGFWGHYAKKKKSQTANDKTVWSFLYVESEKKKRERTDWWLPEEGRVGNIG